MKTGNETSAASFAVFFKRRLFPALKRFERVRVTRLFVLGCMAAAAACLAAYHLFLNPADGLIWWRHGAIGAAATAIAMAAVYIALDFFIFNIGRRIALFSEQIIVPAVNHAIPGRFLHLPEECVPMGKFVDSNLFSGEFNQYRGRDLFRGEGDGYAISFSWLRVEEALSEELKKPYRLFTGWFFVVTFPKRFEGETMIVPDKAEAALSWVGRTVQTATRPKGSELILFEDPEFERLFKVISTDQMDARFVVTPAFMQAAMRVGTRLGGRLRLFFRDNTMFAAVPAVCEYFTSVPTTSFLRRDFTQQIYHAVQGMDDLAQTIAANQKVWAE